MKDSSQCRHTLHKQEDYVSICLNCGSMMFKETISIKPLKYLFKPELNSLKTFNSIIKEKVIRNSSNKNPLFLEKRKEIIKVFHNVIHKLRFKSKTFYLALNLFDKIFSENSELTEFLFYGLACLILSSKFVENDCNIPRLSNFISTSKIECDIDLIKQYEVNSIILLNYKLDNITAYDYVNLFLYNGIVFENEEILPHSNICEEDSPNLQSTLNSSINSPLTFKALKRGYLDKLYNSVKEYLISFTEDSLSTQFEELEIACACVALARSSYKLSYWNTNLEQIYKIEFSDFSKCFEEVNRFFFDSKKRKRESLPCIVNKENLKQSNKKIHLNKSESSIVSPIKIAKFSKVVIDDIPFNLESDYIQNTLEQNVKEMPKFEQIENFILKKHEQIKQYTKSKINILLDNEKETKNFAGDFEKEELDKDLIEIRNSYNSNSGSKIKRSSKKYEGNAEDDLISKTKKIFLKSKNYFSKNINKEYVPKLSGNFDLVSKDIFDYNNNFPFSANNKNNLKISNFQLNAQISEYNIKNLSIKNSKSLYKSQINLSKNVETLPTHFNYGQTNKFKIKQFSDVKIIKNNFQNGPYQFRNYEAYFPNQERKYTSNSRVFSSGKTSENLLNYDLESRKQISSINLNTNIRNLNMNFDNNNNSNSMKTSTHLFKKFSN